MLIKLITKISKPIGKMSKRISQDLYDEVVLENIQTFEMTSEEAITDANEQFKTQVPLFDHITITHINVLK